MTFLRGRRFLRSRLEPVKLRPAAKFDVDAELERRQEIARRILVADGGNVDKPVLVPRPLG